MFIVICHFIGLFGQSIASLSLEGTNWSELDLGGEGGGGGQLSARPPLAPIIGQIFRLLADLFPNKTFE